MKNFISHLRQEKKLKNAKKMKITLNRLEKKIHEREVRWSNTKYSRKRENIIPKRFFFWGKIKEYLSLSENISVQKNIFDKWKYCMAITNICDKLKKNFDQSTIHV